MTRSKPADLIREEADLLAAGLELQHQGLDLLLAEMRALADEARLHRAREADRPLGAGAAQGALALHLEVAEQRFQLAEIRDRPSNVTNRFKTAQLRTEWDVTEGFTVKAGAVWRRFNFDTEAFTRDTAVCGNGGTSLVTSTSGTGRPAAAAGRSGVTSPRTMP